MKKLVEKLYKNKIPHNEGYTFICNENIYVPIFQIYLSITKRVSVSLNLVEEKVLELLDVGVHEINEIVDILGIEKDLLEITIADLYTKDMVYSSSNSCRLLTKGREALKKLGTIERKSDILKDVYVDSVTGDIISNIEQLNLIEKVTENDLKLRVVYKINNIEFFCKKFNDINDIFYNEIAVYQENSKEQIDELVSIDNIDNVFVKFLKLPICLYVNKSGYDIDILCKNKGFQHILDTHKMAILEQIRNRKIMKKIFTRYGINKEYEKKDLGVCEKVEKAISSYYLKKEKCDEDLNFLADVIFSNRKLDDGEIDDIIQYLICQSSSIKIYIDKLDNWAWDTKFITMLSIIHPSTTYKLYYNSVYKEKKALNQIKYSIKTFKDNYFLRIHTFYIKWVFDDKYEILGVPYCVDALEEGIKVKIIDYYFLNV